jgi:hypothetical protein
MSERLMGEGTEVDNAMWIENGVEREREVEYGREGWGEKEMSLALSICMEHPTSKPPSEFKAQ